MVLREETFALLWAATRPEDNTPATAVAAGHFVQVGFDPLTCVSPSVFRGRGNTTCRTWLYPCCPQNTEWCLLHRKVDRIGPAFGGKSA